MSTKNPNDAVNEAAAKPPEEKRPPPTPLPQRKDTKTPRKHQTAFEAAFEAVYGK